MKTFLKFLAFATLGLPCFTYAAVADLFLQATDIDLPGAGACEDLLAWTLTC